MHGSQLRGPVCNEATHPAARGDARYQGKLVLYAINCPVVGEALRGIVLAGAQLALVIMMKVVVVSHLLHLQPVPGIVNLQTKM